MRKIVMMVLVAGSILSSCTQEEQNETLETTNFTALVNKASDLQATGVYKGTFSSYTNDSRGIVMIQLNNAGKAKATLRFADGTEQVIIADTEAANEKDLQAVRFINEAVSFTFTVGQDGAKPLVEGFQLGTTDASMKVLKETTRGPLLPISGSYTCDNCDIHPLLESGVVQTFNATTQSGGGNNEQVILTQIMLSGRDYGTAVGNSQSGCSNSAGVRTCIISGSSATIIGSRAIEWSGVHQFTPGGASCSEVSGTWSFNSQYGLLTGTFTSDTSCGF